MTPNSKDQEGYAAMLYNPMAGRVRICAWTLYFIITQLSFDQSPTIAVYRDVYERATLQQKNLTCNPIFGPTVGRVLAFFSRA